MACTHYIMIAHTLTTLQDFKLVPLKSGRVFVNPVECNLLGFFLKLAKSVLIPFFLALLISFAISPILRFLEKLKIPKPIAVAVILLITFVILYLLGVMFYSRGKYFANELPSYNEMMQDFLAGIDQLFPSGRMKVSFLDWVEGLNIEKVGTFLLSALGPFFSFMTGLLLVFIFMIFILAGRGRMAAKIIRAFPKEQAETLAATIRSIDNEIQRYLAVKTLVNFVIGSLTAVILTIFGLPFAVIFGFLAFLSNYVPTIGAIFAVILPVLMSLFIFDTYGPSLWIFLLLSALHIGLVGQVEPRLMGKGLSLSPLLALFSLFFGWWLWGIPGMILVVPLLFVLKIVFSKIPSLAFLEAMMDK